jgi:O-antigen/teichoic acid export membrane protein
MKENGDEPARMAHANAARAGERRRFSIHVMWTLLARLLMTANSVIAGIIVARWLGAEGLGELAVLNVAVATVVQVSSAGLPSANTYFISKDRNLLAPAALNSLVFALSAGSVLALLLTMLAMWRPGLFSSISPRLVAVASVSIPFQLIQLIGLNVFLALGRIDRFNLLDLASQSFVLVNALLAVVILSRGLWTLVSLNTAVSVLMGILIVWLIGRQALRRKEAGALPLLLLLRPRLFAEMLRYGVKFHVSILAGMLIFRADLLVVNHFRGAAEAGVYAVASQVGMMLMLLPGVIATLLFPRISAGQDAGGHLTCVVSRHTAFVMLLICLLMIPASFVLPLLYGAAFADVSIQLLILLPGVYLIGLESVLVQHFNAAGLPLAIPLFWVATLVVNIALVFALVPVYGARGAAVASTATYAMIFTLVALYFRARTRRTFSETLLPSAGEVRELLTAARVRALPGRV